MLRKIIAIILLIQTQIYCMAPQSLFQSKECNQIIFESCTEQESSEDRIIERRKKRKKIIDTTKSIYEVIPMIFIEDFYCKLGFRTPEHLRLYVKKIWGEILEMENVGDTHLVVHADSIFDAFETSAKIADINSIIPFDFYYRHHSVVDYGEENRTIYIDDIDYKYLNDVNVSSYMYSKLSADRIVITGLYYGKCHLGAYLATIYRFLKSATVSSANYLEIHLPKKYIYKDNFLKKRTGEIILEDAFQQNFSTYTNEFCDLSLLFTHINFQIYENNKCVYSANDKNEKKLKLYFWDDLKDMKKHFEKDVDRDIDDYISEQEENFSDSFEFSNIKALSNAN